MTDVHTPAQRRHNMQRIRAKNTKPELLVRKFLFGRGFRYRLHDKSLPGTPDLILPRYRTVVFVHGCFWHGHEGCRYFVVPKTRTEWWLEKIGINRRNDIESRVKLERMGWRVIIIHECELRPKRKEATLFSLLKTLTLQSDDYSNPNCC